MPAKLRTLQPLNLGHALHDQLLASYRIYKWRAGGPTVPEEVLGRHATLLADSRWSPLDPTGDGLSIACDGSSTCGLSVPDSSALQLSSFTLHVQFLITAELANYGCLCARGEGNGANRDWGLFLPPGTLTELYFTMTGANYGPVTLSTGFALNAWQDVFLTVAVASSGTSANCQLYVNGTPAWGNTSLSTGTPSAGYVSFGNEIGSGGSSIYPFTGYLIPPDLWTRAFSAAEVQSYYDLLNQGRSDLFNYQ